jgi:hypothetical protein
MSLLLLHPPKSVFNLYLILIIVLESKPVYSSFKFPSLSMSFEECAEDDYIEGLFLFLLEDRFFKIYVLIVFKLRLRR